MRFEIYPPLIPNNILSHIQTTSPYFTQEPHFFGRTARRDNPIVLEQPQFEHFITDIRRLLAAESCQVFYVDGEGKKEPVTLAMVDAFIKDRDQEDGDLEMEEVKPETKEEPVPVPQEPSEPVVTVPPAETPAPVETAPAEPTPVVETQPEAPAAPEATSAEEPAKKGKKGKKAQE